MNDCTCVEAKNLELKTENRKLKTFIRYMESNQKHKIEINDYLYGCLKTSATETEELEEELIETKAINSKLVSDLEDFKAEVKWYVGYSNYLREGERKLRDRLTIANKGIVLFGLRISKAERDV